jgi:hypothetical protein
MQTLKTFGLMLITAAILLSCGGKVETITVGNPDAADKILIAMEPSEYKLLLARDVASALDNGSRFITITGLGALKKANPADYKAVIILNAVKAGKPDPKAAAYVAKYPDAGNVAVVNTWGGDPGTIKMDADTVSTASTTDEVAFVRQAIFLALDWDITGD